MYAPTVDEKRRRLFHRNNNVHGAQVPVSTFFAPLRTSIVPVRGTGSATFTRATTATVTDHEGIIRRVLSGEVRFHGARRVRNICTQTETLGGAWTKSNATVATGISDPAGGTGAVKITATGASAEVYQQPASSSAALRGSIWVRRRTGTGQVLIRRPDNVNVDITSQLTTSWQRFAPNVAASSGGVGTMLVAIATSGDEVDVYGPQLEEVDGQTTQTPAEYVSVGVLSAPFHGANVDGVKYFDTTNGNTVASNVVTEATGTPIAATTLLGIRKETAKTNNVLRSEEFDNAAWTNGNPADTAVTADQAASPDGATTADKLKDNSTANTYRHVYRSFTGTAAAWTLTCYAKAAEKTWFRMRLDDDVTLKNAFFNLSGGTVGTTSAGVTASIDALPGGWYRCRMTVTLTAATYYYVVGLASADNVVSYVGVSGDGLYVWGAQLETSAFASSYIPTTSAAVTRNADVLTYPNASNMSGSVGTAYCESTSVGVADGSVCSHVGTSTTGRLIETAETSASRIVDNASNVGTVATTISRTTVSKLAGRWSGSVMNAFAEGAKGADATFSGTMDTGAAIGVGCFGNGANQLNGTIRNVRIWLHALSDSQVKAIS